MNESLYSSISTNHQISDLQEEKHAVPSKCLKEPWCVKYPVTRVRTLFLFSISFECLHKYCQRNKSNFMPINSATACFGAEACVAGYLASKENKV